MPLKLPVRLLDVSLMKVEMYRDIQDDVRKEGYICISHVWGDMKEYSASKLGIKGGVDWKIPLSDPKKLERIRKAVLHQKKKYCWLDLVCIPQGDDRLDERIVEIPHMGSYYEGATMTLVMATYRHPAPAIIRKPVGVIMGALYGTTSMSLKVANMSYRLTDLGMEEEEWFKRVWTFQEAIFSKSLKYVTYSGRHHDLTDILDKITDMSEGKPGDIDDILEHNHELDRLSYAIREYYKGKTDLVEVMSKACWRNRTKDHDVVYGVMAVLGYATLPVRYDITLEELNEAVVRYAYSQGDISWLSVGGNTGKGFIQPVCQTFTRVGKYWKSVNLEQSFVKIVDDGVMIDVCHVADVVYCESFKGKQDDLFTWMVRMFKSQGINNHAISCMLAEYREDLFRDRIRGDLDMLEENGDFIEPKCGFFSMSGISLAEVTLDNIKNDYLTYTFLVASNIHGKFPLMVRGNASVGNKIMLAPMVDYRDRTLGIVTDGHERKGVCLYKLDGHERNYISHRYTI